VRHGAAVLRNAGGIRFREMVQDVQPGPVFRHKPLRGGFRRSGPLFPLHFDEQPLPNEHQVHHRRHTLQAPGPSPPLALGPFLLKRVPGVAHHSLLPRHPPQHPRHGHSPPPSHVRRLHPVPHGATPRPPMHHLVTNLFFLLPSFFTLNSNLTIITHIRFHFLFLLTDHSSTFQIHN